MKMYMKRHRKTSNDFFPISRKPVGGNLTLPNHPGLGQILSDFVKSHRTWLDAKRCLMLNAERR